MDNTYMYSLLIGLAAMGLLAAALVKEGQPAPVRKGIMVFCGAIGILVTLYLNENPYMVRDLAGQITNDVVLIILAALAAALLFWKTRR